mgnify:CR=1 FL=1
MIFFPFKKKTIELEIKGSVHHGWRMNVVIVTFIITILLWVIPKSVTGIDSYNVAMVPIGVFAVTGVITAKDLQEINWSVIWMVAGGFALGFGMNGSGLADAALESILREGMAYPPIDLTAKSPQLIWLYQLVEDRNVLVYASGHLPPANPARLDLARYDAALYPDGEQ